MLRRIFWKLILMALIGVVAIGAINAGVYLTGKSLIVDAEHAQEADAILVLGAAVYPGGRVSPMLADRLNTAYELYKEGKAPKILVSGDHGQELYDEVNTMRLYLEQKGVPSADIFMDHAGFDTYDSIYRARDVFTVRSVLIVTQAFHLPRALYIAQALKLQAQGVVAEGPVYADTQAYEVREMAARVKAFGEVLLRRKPAFLGPVIPITGDGRQTQDQL